MAAISKGDFSIPRFGGLGGRTGSGWANSIARPWVPIGSPLTHMVYLLPFLSYLACSKSVSACPSARPSDPDTTTNAALEAIASSSGKNEASHLRNAWTTVSPLDPRFRGQGAKMSMDYAKANEALESRIPKQ